MALGRQGDRQSELLVTWAEMPRSPGHAFYDRLQAELLSAGFDGFVEGQCAPYYAARQGRGQPHRKLGAYGGVKLEHGAERDGDRTVDGTNATLSAARRGQAPQPRSGAPKAPGLTTARPAEGHWSTPSATSSSSALPLVGARHSHLSTASPVSCFRPWS